MTLPLASAEASADLSPLPRALAKELSDALRSIRYGAIELVIHDSHVVQLARKEKVRFDPELMPRRLIVQKCGRRRPTPDSTHRTTGGRHFKLTGDLA